MKAIKQIKTSFQNKGPKPLSSDWASQCAHMYRHSDSKGVRAKRKGFKLKVGRLKSDK